jgi:hypothetical protein
VYSKYWSSIGGYYVSDDQRIQIGQGNPLAILGMSSEIPLGTSVRFKVSGSYVSELGNGSRTVPGVGLGLRFPVNKVSWFNGVGFGVDYISTNDGKKSENDRTDIRTKFTLEFSDNELSVGIASSDAAKPDASGKYFFLAWEVKSNFFSFRKWF